MTLLRPAAHFAACLAFSLTLAAAAPNEVILVGTAHTMHLKAEFHYSLADLQQEIEALKPDVICGEITPEAYHGPMEGNFPIEAAFLDEIAPALHAKFVPADWRVAMEWQRRANKLTPKEVKDRAAAIDRQQGEDIMGYKGPSLFDYVHSERFLGLSDQKFHEINGEDTAADIAAGAWHERNRKIIENCLTGAGDAQRIVIAIGSNHLAQLRRELTTQGVPFRIATRSFTPTTAPVPANVVARWRKNLANIKRILSSELAVSRNDRETVKSNRRNLEEIETAVEAATH